MEKPNLNYIKKIASGDEEFQNKILNIIRKEIIHESQEYKNLLDQKEYKKLGQLIHKIKHKMNILGMESSVQIANQIEYDLRSNNISNLYKIELIIVQIKQFLLNH